MPSLHALYDALVSINVPSQKALAVVESMERDMLSQLATKSDVEHAQLLMRADVEGLRNEVKASLDGFRAEIRVELDGFLKEVRVEIDGLRKEFKADMALLQSTMTVRLGSMLMVGFSLMFAGLKFI